MFAHVSGTANKILPRNCQRKSKLIVYLQLECYKNKLRFNRFTYKKFSGPKFLGHIITYPLEFTWITAKTYNKQLVGRSLGPTEMLWVELKMFFQPERN